MTELPVEFVNCVLSASCFTASHGSGLDFVSIKSLERAHEICGTDGFVMAVYTFNDNVNWCINGYVNLKNLKISEDMKVISAFMTVLSNSKGIIVNFKKEEGYEHVFIPVFEEIFDFEYPTYSKLIRLNLHSPSIGERGSFNYGEFLIDSNEVLSAIERFDHGGAKVIGLMPSSIDSSNPDRCRGVLKFFFNPEDKQDTINCDLIVDVARMKYRESPRLESKIRLDLNSLKVVLRESIATCSGLLSLHIGTESSVIHIKGANTDSWSSDRRCIVYANYVIAPVFN